MVLQLLALGVADPARFDFMDAPPADLVAGALRELHLLGAVESPDRPVLTGKKNATVLRPSL